LRWNTPNKCNSSLRPLPTVSARHLGGLQRKSFCRQSPVGATTLAASGCRNRSCSVWDFAIDVLRDAGRAVCLARRMGSAATGHEAVSS
jgi:hypothetical protein